jgi:predicted Rossmann fold flavoprotein
MRVLIVGGGAAGLVAAWRAASAGHHAILLEANAKPGVKLRISGGGKCNITHAGSVKEVLAAFPKAQARFLRPAMHAFTNDQVLDLLRRRGVETYVRDNGRVFPLDRPGSAAAVVAAFQDLVVGAGVDLRTGVRATGLLMEGLRVRGVRTESGDLDADAVILATGGASYPETGTRGEILGWLKALDLPTRSWFPALAPIPLRRSRPAWEGVALREGRLVLQTGEGGRRLAEFGGDLVFTKAGISGPAALELSEPAEVARREGKSWLLYATGLGREVMETSLMEEQRANPQLKAATWLQRHLPERLCADFVREAGLPEDQRLKDLPKEGRRRLAAWAAEVPLGEPGAVPLERGEVAAGGLRLEAVDPHTMRVRGIEGLYACGELLDVNGPVGGYNLQAAFSTGFAAGSLGQP